MANCCENCGWSETIGSPIMCNYNGHRTFRDEVCPAWKPKEEKTNMVEIVRCKDCDRGQYMRNGSTGIEHNYCKYHRNVTPLNWFCADGKRKDGVSE